LGGAVAERRQCEFFVVRYVPDTIRDEFVNIGVVLREAEGKGQPQIRFTRDWARVRCVDPEADIAMLEALEAEVRSRLSGEDSLRLRPIMEVLEDSLSNAVQITPAKGCLAETMPAELEQLMRMYVEPRKTLRKFRSRGRAAILTRMRSQFERAGIWDLLRKRIPASTYTRPGDPLRLDCGYRPNGLIRMFHAVSLDGDQEMAKVLSFSASAIREGVRRVEKAEFELTAIVEPLAEVKGVAEDEDRLMQYRFAVETMEQQTIRVLTTSDLSRVAEAARYELRV
jgi:hypothetical protein